MKDIYVINDFVREGQRKGARPECFVENFTHTRYLLNVKN
jgi:hypothetical protein